VGVHLQLMSVGFFEGFEARNTYIAKPFFDTILHNVLECFLGFMNQR